MSRRIVTALAMSPRLESVAAEGMSLAAALGAEAIFVHAGEEDGGDAAFLKETLERGATGRGVIWRLVIRKGPPAEVVVECAAREEADLIVLGAREKDALWTGLFGSVARRIVRQSTCDVLLLTNPQPTGTRFERVAISLPPEQLATPMMNDVLDMCARLNATELLFVHEVNPLLMRGNRLGGDAGRAEGQRVMAEELEQLASFLAGFNLKPFHHEPLCVEGRDGLESVSIARRRAANLLIISAPPRRLTLWDRFFNAATENVLEALPCAVLVWRPDAPRNKEA